MRIENSITIRVPGSTANLGPGFDTIALALGIYLELTVTLLSKPENQCPLISSAGPNGEYLGESASAFILKIIKDYLNLDQSILGRLQISIQSQIPLARGLGSSAAVVVGVLSAINKLIEQKTDCNKLLCQAIAIEGHADNAAASLLGGLAIVAQSNDQHTVLARKLAWPEKWHTVLVIPNHQVATQQSRQVLPNKVSYKDAIHNLQHTALLLAAVQSEDDHLMQESLHDQLHEKYRSQLVPELELLRSELAGGPSIGCALSGAGSSILVLTHKDKKTDVLAKLLFGKSKSIPSAKYWT